MHFQFFSILIAVALLGFTAMAALIAICIKWALDTNAETYAKLAPVRVRRADDFRPR